MHTKAQMTCDDCRDEDIEQLLANQAGMTIKDYIHVHVG